MYYWRQQDFEGLKAIGAHYATRPDYQLFSEYCQLKECGLKKPALAKLRAFVAEVEQLPVAKQREMMQELLDLVYYNRDIYSLQSFPLSMLQQQVMEQWREEQPDNIIPWRWLAQLRNDFDCYDKVLELDPNDEIANGAMAHRLLNSVDFSCHHLGESVFLGNVAVCRRELDDALSYIAKLTDTKRQQRYLAEVDELAKMLDCWEQYCADTGADKPDFPDWCQAKGDAFSFWGTIYYTK